MGRERYPYARQLLIIADGGGSNGHRVRLWKLKLSSLAQETGLKLRVFRYPLGTSRWNKIERRLFSFISKNQRSRALVSHEVIVQLIANTKSRSGLTVRTEIDSTSVNPSRCTPS